MKVQQFLDSKARNSQQTKRVYSFALSHSEKFLSKERYNIETVLTALTKNKIDVYALIDRFVNYLMNITPKLSEASIELYVAGVKSYLEFYDVDISSNKFRRKVTMPKKRRINKEPLDAQTITTLLQECNNQRLKVFLLVLASSGMRAKEAITLKDTDIDFDSDPTKIHIRAENTKTRTARVVYISDEASKHLKKYMKNNSGLVFTLMNESDPRNLYVRLHGLFIRLLDRIEMNGRLEGHRRRKITFHSFRTFVKSQVAIHTNSDFSEWLLGHSGSTYWNIPESQRIELYKKCMKFLTFLDYPTVESVGRDFESKLEEQEQRHQLEMKQVNEKYDQIIDAMSKNPILSKVKADVLKKKIKKK